VKGHASQEGFLAWRERFLVAISWHASLGGLAHISRQVSALEEVVQYGLEEVVQHFYVGFAATASTKISFGYWHEISRCFSTANKSIK
jgi:hypothetical protein